ncbi:hypothetical protein [Staphylococcus auricularis]|nr:hypothetical protein [Staphylococcus auricularis]
MPPYILTLYLIFSNHLAQNISQANDVNYQLAPHHKAIYSKDD